MGIGAAGNDAEALGCKTGRQRLRVRDDLPLIGDEFGRHGFQEADRLGRDDVNQRTALHAREDRLVDRGAVFLPRQNQCRSAGRAESCAWWR